MLCCVFVCILVCCGCHSQIVAASCCLLPELQPALEKCLGSVRGIIDETVRFISRRSHQASHDLNYSSQRHVMTDTLESSACFVVFLCVSWFAAVVMARPYSQIVAASCCLLPELQRALEKCLGSVRGIIDETVRFISRRSHQAAHDLNYSSQRHV